MDTKFNCGSLLSISGAKLEGLKMDIKYSKLDQRLKSFIDYLDFLYCGLIGHKYFNTGVKAMQKGTFIFQCKRCHCTITHKEESL